MVVRRESTIELLTDTGARFDANALLQTLEETRDPAVLSFVASCLLHLVNQADLSQFPSDTASQLLRTIYNIGTNSHGFQRYEAKEALGPLFSALVDLARARRDDLHFVQASVGASKDPGSLFDWAKGLLQAMFLDEATFIPGCLLLALVAEHEGARQVLRDCGVLSKISRYIVKKKNAIGLYSSIDVPFVTIATVGVEVLCPLTLKDMSDEEKRWGPPPWARGAGGQDIVEAVMESLNDDLLRGDMVAKPLHLAGLRTLSHMAALSRDCGLRIVEENGLRIGAKILASNASHQDVVLAALEFIAATAPASNRGMDQLEALGIFENARMAQKKYSYDKEIQRQVEEIIPKPEIPFVKPRWPRSEPSGRTTGVVVKAPTRQLKCR